MSRGEEVPGDPVDAASQSLSEQRAEFVKGWLRANLPPFYKPCSVVELAAKLRKDAAAAGIDLSKIADGSAFAIEQIVLRALDARVAKHWPASFLREFGD